MVYINNEHHNYSAPPGTFGGALCMCPDCRAKRREMKPEKTMLEQQLDTSEGAVTMATEEYLEAMRALKQCIKVLRMWHGPEAFEIYYDKSPEMALVREMLPEYRVPDDD